MKKSLGARTILYPTPVLIVGTICGGQTECQTAAWGGSAARAPPGGRF